MPFKAWDVRKISRKPLRFDDPQRKRSPLEGVDPKLKQIAYDKLAILRELNFRLSNPKGKSKDEVIRVFLADLRSGVLWPDRGRPIPCCVRATIYNWQKALKKGGIAALVPRYKTKLSITYKAHFQPLLHPFEMKFSGPPRRNGKAFFIERLKRRWKWGVAECPIRLSVFYYMPVPKGATMDLRGKLLKQKIPHVLKPDLDALDPFIVSCLTGIVFKDRSQLIQFHSEKLWGWWPHIRILIGKG